MDGEMLVLPLALSPSLARSPQMYVVAPAAAAVLIDAAGEDQQPAVVGPWLSLLPPKPRLCQT